MVRIISSPHRDIAPVRSLSPDWYLAHVSPNTAGAVNVSRSFLEFRVDPDSPSHDKNFAKDKNVIVYCGSGGRAALSGKLLKDMGYERVYNLGGFKDWADAGGEVEE